MTTLHISDQLAREIQNEAQTRGLPVEDYLQTVVRRERTLASRRKIEQEQAWWLNQPLSERAKYEGQFVAVHNQTLLDHDQDERVLYQRIRARFGNTAVLIMPADGPREIRIFSPRLVRE
ncbi:MAG TPA: hypothetical protein VJG32_03510 [Anaerolineae bacterium]|nr:hypothetical protein [Anaerolineae bacterium]